MSGKSTIIINGRHYDIVSGLPIEQKVGNTLLNSSTVGNTKINSSIQDDRDAKKRNVAKVSRPKPQHSTTLRRDLVKKPVGKYDHVSRSERTRVHATRSPQITKFAPHPIIKEKTNTPAQTDSHSAIITLAHKRFAEKTAQKNKSKALSSRELREYLDTAKPVVQKPSKSEKQRPARRVSSIITASFAIMLLGGYLSYINMPNLSVRVAAAQAGIDASYPSYTPSGYRFDGPVAYTDGSVTLSFAANGGTSRYSITQKLSNWNSLAVLDNLVAKADRDYAINASKGLTIYTYGQNAAWVNRGVLYTLSGDAPLKTDQVLRIANSL